MKIKWPTLQGRLNQPKQTPEEVIYQRKRMNANTENIDFNTPFENRRFFCGRMISPYKESPKGCQCIFNANIISPSKGKIWYGDINLTKEGNILKEIAEELGETLFVLREMDCRFETEGDPTDVLITKAVWNTSMELPK